VNRTLADSRIIVIYDKSRSLKENIEELPMG
jgi:hypothetical protein